MQIAELASLDVILIVVVVIALIFGSTKIPKIARGLGSAKSEFEKGVKEGDTAKAADDASKTTDTTKTDKPTS
jgi:sec-independent protein translocase protein TatA